MVVFSEGFEAADSEACSLIDWSFGVDSCLGGCEGVAKVLLAVRY